MAYLNTRFDLTPTLNVDELFRDLFGVTTKRRCCFQRV